MGSRCGARCGQEVRMLGKGHARHSMKRSGPSDKSPRTTIRLSVMLLSAKSQATNEQHQPSASCLAAQHFCQQAGLPLPPPPFVSREIWPYTVSSVNKTPFPRSAAHHVLRVVDLERDLGLPAVLPLFEVRLVAGAVRLRNTQRRVRALSACKGRQAMHGKPHMCLMHARHHD